MHISKCMSCLFSLPFSVLLFHTVVDRGRGSFLVLFTSYSLSLPPPPRFRIRVECRFLTLFPRPRPLCFPRQSESLPDINAQPFHGSFFKQHLTHVFCVLYHLETMSSGSVSNWFTYLAAISDV